MFHKTLDEACAGDQMGILLRGVKKDDVRRGMCVAKPGTVKQFDNFEAQVTYNGLHGRVTALLIKEALCLVGGCHVACQSH